MARTVRLSLALLFALMMVIASASAALAFQPPGESGLTGFEFPAIENTAFTDGMGLNPMPNAGPWHATECGPNPSPASQTATTDGPLVDGPIDFNDDLPSTTPCP